MPPPFVDDGTVVLIGGLCFFGFVVLFIIGMVTSIQEWKATSYLARKADEQKMQAGNPNLIPCQDCGHLISKRAVACPNCGCPLVPEK